MDNCWDTYFLSYVDASLLAYPGEPCCGMYVNESGGSSRIKRLNLRRPILHALRMVQIPPSACVGIASALQPSGGSLHILLIEAPIPPRVSEGPTCRTLRAMTSGFRM